MRLRRAWQVLFFFDKKVITRLGLLPVAIHAEVVGIMHENGLRRRTVRGIARSSRLIELVECDGQGRVHKTELLLSNRIISRGRVSFI